MIGCKQPFFLFHSALQIYIFITVHYNKPTGLLQVISVKNAVLEKKFQFLSQKWKKSCGFPRRTSDF
jgi:hypothetical protein